MNIYCSVLPALLQSPTCTCTCTRLTKKLNARTLMFTYVFTHLCVHQFITNFLADHVESKSLNPSSSLAYPYKTFELALSTSNRLDLHCSAPLNTFTSTLNTQLSTLKMDDNMIPLVAAGLVIVVISVVVYMYASKERNPIALTLDFQKYPLIDKKIISHDTRRFTFALPSPNHKLGLPIGQHMTLMFKDKDGKGVQRSYTPVTGDETLGTVSFVIKVYKAGVHPKFPEGGKLSQYLDSLKIGDKLDMKGPKGHLSWLGRGNFTVKVMRKPLSTRKATHIGMIAGGTGITPMLQVLDAIFRDPNDKTCIKMLYANQCKLKVRVVLL